jgi:hypothetical protein
MMAKTISTSHANNSTMPRYGLGRQLPADAAVNREFDGLGCAGRRSSSTQNIQICIIPALICMASPATHSGGDARVGRGQSRSLIVTDVR